MIWRWIWQDVTTGRLRSGWRVLIFLVLSILFTLLLSIFPVAVLAQHISLRDNPLLVAFVYSVAALIAFLLVSLWALPALDRLPSSTLGLPLRPRWAGVLILAFAAGMALIAVLLTVLWAANAVTVNAAVPAARTLTLMLGVAGALFLLAAQEEIIFRGYLFQTLLRGIGPMATLLFTSLAFALIHLGNPFEGSLSLHALFIGNVFLAGVVAGLLYLRTGTLWASIGWHAGWNFAQFFFGTPISGVALPFRTFITTQPLGPTWLTGGANGPEAGVIATGVLLLVVAALIASRHGLPLHATWWQWRELMASSPQPLAWDFTMGDRYYQLKLQSPRENE